MPTFLVLNIKCKKSKKEEFNYSYRRLLVVAVIRIVFVVVFLRYTACQHENRVFLHQQRRAVLTVHFSNNTLDKLSFLCVSRSSNPDVRKDNNHWTDHWCPVMFTFQEYTSVCLRFRQSTSHHYFCNKFKYHHKLSCPSRITYFCDLQFSAQGYTFLHHDLSNRLFHIHIYSYHSACRKRDQEGPWYTFKYII